jgi:hypothetical protein
MVSAYKAEKCLEKKFMKKVARAVWGARHPPTPHPVVVRNFLLNAVRILLSMYIIYV